MVEGHVITSGVDILEKRGVLPGRFTALTCDSRSILPGSLFVALRGSVYDGHQFVKDAADAGAGAAVVDTVCESVDLPQIRVSDTLAALPRIAANFYGHPSRAMRMIGITGSNGKTTSTLILENILQGYGESVGLIGTIEYHYANQKIEASNTTPLPHELQRLLHEMLQAGCTCVVMEVSSHGLVLHRVDEIVYDIALFTNLSQDHLDFHKDMDDYREAKKLLFTHHLKPDGLIILNRDDQAGRTYEQELTHQNILTYSIRCDADFRATEIQLGIDGSQFNLHTPGGSREIETRLIGRHNVENLLGVTAAAWAYGVPLDRIVEGIQTFNAVPGRLESIENSIGAQVVVDYSHTPDALEKCLEALQAIPHERIITIFGCGGDRDRKKRPLMGEIALRLSDVTIVTSDNPRTEDPDRIIEDIVAGMTSGKSYRVIPDRHEAIRAGVEELDTGDILLIAGKGHENYQILGRQKVHFDDREEARRYLREMGKGD
jgi:UDP-N-acetylmuramoyl-L-alanyl-D-glutamate--2,6-diaminopimelate ligase